MELKGINIDHYQHNTLRLSNREVVIYIDPYEVREEDKADIILISHPHYDHCSPEDLRKVVTKESVIVTVADAQSKLAGLEFKELKLLRPGESVDVRGVKVIGVPAYNTNKSFHPKQNEWLGFIVEINGVRIYYAGDTDLIEEMKGFGKIDIAFLPVSGTYVMTAEEAAQAARIIKPSVAIPIHYGSIVGSKNDAETFKKLLEGSGVDVVII